MGAVDDEEATLLFHEQADGRKVGCLLSGKVVLVGFGAAGEDPGR